VFVIRIDQLEFDRYWLAIRPFGKLRVELCFLFSATQIYSPRALDDNLLGSLAFFYSCDCFINYFEDTDIWPVIFVTRSYKRIRFLLIIGCFTCLDHVMLECASILIRLAIIYLLKQSCYSIVCHHALFSSNSLVRLKDRLCTELCLQCKFIWLFLP